MACCLIPVNIYFRTRRQATVSCTAVTMKHQLTVWLVIWGNGTVKWRWLIVSRLSAALHQSIKSNQIKSFNSDSTVHIERVKRKNTEIDRSTQLGLTNWLTDTYNTDDPVTDADSRADAYPGFHQLSAWLLQLTVLRYCIGLQSTVASTKGSSTSTLVTTTWH